MCDLNKIKALAQVLENVLQTKNFEFPFCLPKIVLYI